jgi:hypothetical protein
MRNRNYLLSGSDFLTSYGSGFVSRPKKVFFNFFKNLASLKFFFVYCFGGLECVGHSFAYVAHL